MSLLDGALRAVFGSAFAALYLDATLVKDVSADTGRGGFTLSATTYPVKAMVEARSDKARAASGLPESAVTLSLLRAGLSVAVDLDDRVTVAGSTYRVIRVETDPAEAAWSAVAVPAAPS